jgi:hypothetical protein
MGNYISGYVSSYTLNPDTNLYTCQLTTVTFPTTPSSSFKDVTSSTQLGIGIINVESINMIQKFTQLPVTNITIDLIPINNDWNLKSPNDPNQMIIMSSDNKYIFLNRFFPPPSQLYQLLYAIIKNNIRIPSIINYMIIGNYTPTDDGVYSTLSNENDIMWYKNYLIGKNPPQELLNIDSNKNTWNELSLIYKTYYDFNYNSFQNPIPFCYNYTTIINNPTFDPNNLISSTSCQSSINKSKTSKLNTNPIPRPVSKLWYKNSYLIIGLILLIIIIAFIIYYMLSKRSSKKLNKLYVNI